MSIVAKKILEQLTSKLNKAIKDETNFFDKPLSLKTLNLGAITALSSISDNYISELTSKVNINLNDQRAIKNFLKNDPIAKNILKYSSKNLDDDILNEMLLKCQNIKNNIKDFESIKTYGKINNEVISSFNDLNNKIIENKEKIGTFINDNIEYLSSGILLIYIIKLTIDLFSNTEFPSQYRLKYIQKLIRTSLVVIWDKTSEEFEKVKNVFKQVDEFLITLGVASALYLYNKKNAQAHSQQLLLRNGCQNFPEGTNPYEGVTSEEISENINSTDFNIPLTCPVPLKRDPVPKEPYENKLDNFTCEIPSEPDIEEIETSLTPELAQKAIIINKSSEILTPVIKKNNKVTNKDIIATLGDRSVYSPTNGYINSLSENKIEIREIFDSTDDYLNKTINELNSLYQEYNNIKTFIKDWRIPTLYIEMLGIKKNSNPPPSSIGMEDEFDKILQRWNIIKNKYDENIKNITSKDNIRKNAENESLDNIKNSIDNEEDKIFKYLKTIENEAIEIGKDTKQKEGEYILIEYYLYNILPEMDSEEYNTDIIKPFKNKIYEYVRKRYKIDNFSKNDIKNKIKELLEKLKFGSLTSGSQYWDISIEKYNQTKKIEDIENWLNDLGRENRNIPETLKSKLINRLVFLYELYFNEDEIIEENTREKEESSKSQTKEEANYISSYFNKLWKRLKKIPNEIKRLEKRIENLSLTSRYFIKEENGEQYRYYTIPRENKKSDCISPLVNNTAHELNDINYWIKYMSFATLASVINPINGWSTGLILPSGPIKLPTVYIPIKPIETNFGFILLGLTITGIWVYPLILYVNLTGEFAMPIPALDPTNAIKKQIESLKTSINNELSIFKKETLKQYLDKKEKEINLLEDELESIEDLILNHKLNRPSKQDELYNEWKKTKIKLNLDKKEVKLKKWSEEKKYHVVNRAYTTESNIKNESGESDPSISAMEKTEEIINNQLDKLSSLVDKISSLLRVIPGVLNPYSSNFGFSLKQPKISNEIEDELNDNVNQEPLNNLFNKYKLNNEDQMKEGSKFKWEEYQLALMAAMPAIVKKDAFPAYENLKITNLPWMAYLNLSFVPLGAKTYGIPGQQPL